MLTIEQYESEIESRCMRCINGGERYCDNCSRIPDEEEDDDNTVSFEDGLSECD